MRVVGLPTPFYHAGNVPFYDPGSTAEMRWRWVSYFESFLKLGKTGPEASRILGVPRSTLYRWRRSLREKGPKGLEDKSRRPKSRRQPTWSVETADAVLRLREQYPHWGKDKVVVLLKRQGRSASTSMVGRILAHLKTRGLLREPPRSGILARKRSRPRPYAIRKPKEYRAYRPGELVEIDTMDVRPLPGEAFKHFTARDVVSRYDVVEVRRRATANTAAEFLATVVNDMPFPVKAIQVDGGSEFKAVFEEACQKRRLRLFVLPPHSPKLNGHVERAHRTHVEEFYETYDGDLDLSTLSAALKGWQHIYNFERPHQALDMRTPAEYLMECHPELAPPLPRLICSERVQRLDFGHFR